MISLKPLSEKTFAILGLGRSGMAAAHALALVGANVFAHDDEISPPMPQGVAVMQPEKWDWENLDGVVFSPGIPHTWPHPHKAATLAKKHNVPIISDIELMMMAKPKAKIIGITGTNGKSTVVSLLAHMFEISNVPFAVGGNIGTPALDLKDINGVIILELSSYQLDITPSLSLDAGAVTSITPDHLERHGGWNGYVKAKTNLARSIKQNGCAVLGDQETAKTLAVYSKAPVTIAAPDNKPQNPNLAGEHNAINATIASVIAQFFGLRKAAINKAIASYQSLPHRMQPIGNLENIRFVNDSKATNGDATAQALKSYNRIYWIAGGKPKEDGIGAAAKYLNNVKHAYLIGEAAKLFKKQIAGACPAMICSTLEIALNAAVKDALSEQEDATILLSPAAASFDQFNNFEERGTRFCQLVRNKTKQQETAYA